MIKDALDSIAEVARGTVKEPHVKWGHGSAHQLKRLQVDAEGIFGLVSPVSPAKSRYWLRCCHGLGAPIWLERPLRCLCVNEGAFVQFLCSQLGGDVISNFRPLQPRPLATVPEQLFTSREDVIQPRNWLSLTAGYPYYSGVSECDPFFVSLVFQLFAMFREPSAIRPRCRFLVFATSSISLLSLHLAFFLCSFFCLSLNALLFVFSEFIIAQVC